MGKIAMRKLLSLVLLLLPLTGCDSPPPVTDRTYWPWHQTIVRDNKCYDIYGHYCGGKTILMEISLPPDISINDLLDGVDVSSYKRIEVPK